MERVASFQDLFKVPVPHTGQLDDMVSGSVENLLKSFESRYDMEEIIALVRKEDYTNCQCCACYAS